MRRKIVALMLAGVMATSFTACGGSSASDSSSQKTSNSNSVSQKKEEKKEPKSRKHLLQKVGTISVMMEWRCLCLLWRNFKQSKC